MASDTGKTSATKYEVKKESRPCAARHEAEPAEDYWKEAREARLEPFSFTGYGYKVLRPDVVEIRRLIMR